MEAFPKELAKIVARRWDHMVAGQYVTPPRPPDRLLRKLLDTIYLAAALPEEGRYPQFNVVAVPSEDTREERFLGEIWAFNNPRPLSVDEIHRLAPAVDFKKSAILVNWGIDGWMVEGLVDLGTSWNRARLGLQYQYRFPACLFVQVDRPGRIRVYQGQYLVVALVDGRLERHKGLDFQLALHKPANGGLRKIWREISYPKIESPREYENFQFIAFWNTYAALANCISEEGHGGAIIIAPRSANPRHINIKYPQNSSILRTAFVAFMNIRHRVIDFVIRMEEGDESVKGEWALAELELAECHTRLVEAIRFIARLAGCDGAIVISDDLRVLGFGAEIRSELKAKTRVRQIKDEMRRISTPLKPEQFGQRHRSAIKLVSRQPNYCVLVVSQDGPITFVWSDKRNVVNVRKNLNLVNMNMPWA